MLTVVSDTHGREGHRLEGRTLDAVREADCVVHAGDFLAAPVLDAFEREVEGTETSDDRAAERFEAVAGNNDEPAVRDRLPDERVVEYRGARVAVTHGHRKSETQLSLFARQSMAHLLVVGHSHRPGFGHVGDVPVLNPGSHAEPRAYRAAHAEIEVRDGDISGALVQPDGTLIEEFAVEVE